MDPTGKTCVVTVDTTPPQAWFVLPPAEVTYSSVPAVTARANGADDLSGLTVMFSLAASTGAGAGGGNAQCDRYVICRIDKTRRVSRHLRLPRVVDPL
jgi:hypothetical protein